MSIWKNSPTFQRDTLSPLSGNDMMIDRCTLFMHIIRIPLPCGQWPVGNSVWTHLKTIRLASCPREFYWIIYIVLYLQNLNMYSNLIFVNINVWPVLCANSLLLKNCICHSRIICSPAYNFLLIFRTFYFSVNALFISEFCVLKIDTCNSSLIQEGHEVLQL